MNKSPPFLLNKKLIVSSIGMIGSLGGTVGICVILTSVSNAIPYIDYWNAKNIISYENPSLKQGTHKETISDVWYPSGSLDDFSADNPNKNRIDRTCMVLDGTTHSAFDHNFNQSTLQGETNFVYQRPHDIDGTAKWQKPSSDSPQGFENTYAALSDSGVENIIMSGFVHETPLVEWLDKRSNNNAGAIFIDGDVTNQYVANILFRADESAFMSGLAIGEYLNENFGEYIKDGQLSVGTFGGLAIPTVTIFMGGLELGVWTYNQMLTEYWNYFQAKAALPENTNWGWGEDPQLSDHLIKFTSLGIKNSFFSGNFAQGDGRSVVQELLARKTSCIMPVAGPQTIDTVQEIVNQHSHCAVIGVDVAQELDPTVQRTSSYIDNNSSNNVIKFSAEKDIANMTWDVLDAIKNKNPNSAIGAYGYLTVGDINNNGARSSEASLKYLLDFFNTWLPHDPQEDLPEEIDDFNDVKDIILHKSIDTPNEDHYDSWLDMINDNMEFRC